YRNDLVDARLHRAPFIAVNQKPNRRESQAIVRWHPPFLCNTNLHGFSEALPNCVVSLPNKRVERPRPQSHPENRRRLVIDRELELRAIPELDIRWDHEPDAQRLGGRNPTECATDKHRQHQGGQESQNSHSTSGESPRIPHLVCFVSRQW